MRSLPLLVLPAVLATAGCDNPACVFGPDQCRGDSNGGGGGPGGLGSQSAVFPDGPSWIRVAPPELEFAAPDIADAHPLSPLVLQFDQSLDPDSLGGAFTLFDALSNNEITLLDPPALVGDGRVVVVVPATPMPPSSRIVLSYAADQKIKDVTGQPLELEGDLDILELGVSDDPPDDPRLLYTFPRDFTANQSDLTEIVAVFDRRMDAASFDDNSFVVTVDGGPPPQSLLVSLLLTGGVSPVPVTQVWQWRAIDASGNRLSLGAGASVDIELSPSGNPLSAEGMSGGTLATTAVEFETAPFAAPSASAKAPGSEPSDAIGRPNLAGGGPVLRVTLPDPAQAGDDLQVYAIGTSPSNPSALRALQRSVDLTGGATTVDLTEADLDLLEPNGTPRISDGELELMVLVRRGSAVSIARRTDADDVAIGPQRLILDTTAPSIVGLGTSGAVTSAFQSDLRDFVVVGRANEEVRFATVTTMASGDNRPMAGVDPETLLASEGGLFVAAPVPTGVVDPANPAIQYTVQVFDRAKNPAPTPAVGTFDQRGGVGPGAALPGPMVDVRVFAADTLAPLAGALVASHEENGGAVAFRGSATTDAFGVATVPSAAAGETLVTVQLANFDTFTLHGVPTTRLDVLLVRSGTSLATVEGTVYSPFPSANFTADTNLVGDNRLPRPGDVLAEVGSCALGPDGQTYECPYGPVGVLGRRIGVQTFFASDPSLPQGSFSAGAFLRGFALGGPYGPLTHGQAFFGADLDVENALSFLPPAQSAEAIAAHAIDAMPALMDGLGPTLDPRGPVVTVEAVVPGIRGTLPVGLGLPYSVSATDWAVLGAIPGVVSMDGELVERGTVESDLLLRSELLDTNGNRAGRRPRLSTSGGVLDPIGVPTITVPGPGGSTGGDAYNVTLTDVLPDSLGHGGVYRVVVRDPNGRRWRLWTFDTPDAAGDLLVSVPDLAAAGGTALADGAQMAGTSVWGWAGFDPAEFLWTDVERLHEVFAHGAEIPYTQD